MKLAIVGSTRLSDHQEEAARRIIGREIEAREPSAIVSGGADGVDTLAENMGRQYGLPVIVCKPALQRWEQFKVRNLLIAELCDELVRVVKKDSKTYGSGCTRDRAQEMGKPTEEYKI